MNLPQRIALLTKLGIALEKDSPSYQAQRERAFQENKWFTPEFILDAGRNIARQLLQQGLLNDFAQEYGVPEQDSKQVCVGLVMAGNIPFVGFHDMLCIFLFGYSQRIKLSSKDSVLMKMIVDTLIELDPAAAQFMTFSDMLKNADAYIATGSNNSARYFDYYFSKYPHIIRKNRTSIALLDGKETSAELDALADDIQRYFGLGCRNVTQLLVPQGYDFVPLLNALKKYGSFLDHDKYKNNFDYQLTIALLNKKYYMSSDSLLLVEDESPFSPIAQLHYRYYNHKEEAISGIDPEKIQCVVGRGLVPFGTAQQPQLRDFADGVDTMVFLKSLQEIVK
jgi:hypothetical protein